MKNNREHYLSVVAGIIVPFLNDAERDSGTVAHEFIDKMRITDTKAQCMVKLMFHHMAQFASIAYADVDAHEFVKGIVGLDTNVLVDIAMDNWDELNNKLS